MEQSGDDLPLSSSHNLLNISQTNQDKLKGVADYNGFSFYLLDENRECLP